MLHLSYTYANSTYLLYIRHKIFDGCHHLSNCVCLLGTKARHKDVDVTESEDVVIDVGSTHVIYVIPSISDVDSCERNTIFILTIDAQH